MLIALVKMQIPRGLLFIVSVALIVLDLCEVELMDLRLELWLGQLLASLGV